MMDSRDINTPATASSEELPLVTSKVKLKWFNDPKGFGFVIPEDDETKDAFIHITKLQEVGIHTLGEGASLVCAIQYGPKGAQVTQVIEVIDQGDVGDYQNLHKDIDDIGKTVKMGGTVKWYKPQKGFGFIIPDDNGKDVFIHKSCLEKFQLPDLQTGQRTEIVFRIVPKGREVVSLKIIEEDIEPS